MQVFLGAGHALMCVSMPVQLVKYDVSANGRSRSTGTGGQGLCPGDGKAFLIFDGRRWRAPWPPVVPGAELSAPARSRVAPPDVTGGQSVGRRSGGGVEAGDGRTRSVGAPCPCCAARPSVSCRPVRAGRDRPRPVASPAAIGLRPTLDPVRSGTGEKRAGGPEGTGGPGGLGVWVGW